MEQLELFFYIASGSVKWHNDFRELLAVLFHDLVVLLLSIYPREMITLCTKTFIKNVHSNFMHIILKLETTQVFINRMDK